MGKYNGAVITTAGQNFFASAIAGGQAVTFTTMVSSSYAYPATAELQSLTSLQDVVQTVDISYAGVYNNNVVQVSARFDNANVLSAYLINTLGLYAQVGSDSPVLVAVITAVTPDQMPAEDPESPSAFIYNVQMTIDNASQIQVTVNPAGTVNVDQLRQYIEKAGGDAADAVVGSAAAQTADYPIPAVGDTFKVILGKIAKFFADIKQAIVGLSVSGKTVTYTRADGTTGTITTQDTTYGVVSKTAAGLAPQLPNETTTTKYLRQDGSWQVPPNTTYSLSSTSANGLMCKLPESNQNTRFMRGDGNWGTIQNNLTTTGAGNVLDARQGKALNDKINLIGSVSAAEGTYKTKADGTPGTNTCVWKAPSAGQYLVLVRFQAQSYSTDFGGYKMFQVKGTSPRIWDNLGQYADNAPYIFTAALWAYPSAANQTLTPVVLSNKVVTYDVNIDVYRFK